MFGNNISLTKTYFNISYQIILWNILETVFCESNMIKLFLFTLSVDFKSILQSKLIHNLWFFQKLNQLGLFDGQNCWKKQNMLMPSVYNKLSSDIKIMSVLRENGPARDEIASQLSYIPAAKPNHRKSIKRAASENHKEIYQNFVIRRELLSAPYVL